MSQRTEILSWFEGYIKTDKILIEIELEKCKLIQELDAAPTIEDYMQLQKKFNVLTLKREGVKKLKTNFASYIVAEIGDKIFRLTDNKFMISMTDTDGEVKFEMREEYV